MEKKKALNDVFVIATLTFSRSQVTIYSNYSIYFSKYCMHATMARQATRKRSKDVTNPPSGVRDDVSELISNIAITLKNRGLFDWKVLCLNDLAYDA